MLKSIRWTLQLWHASLLAVVLIAFGTTTYISISRTRYRQIDADLERNVQLLAAGIHPGPRQNDGGPNGGRGGPDFRPNDFRPNDFRRGGWDGRPFDQRPFDQRPPDQQPPGQPPFEQGPPPDFQNDPNRPMNGRGPATRPNFQFDRNFGGGRGGGGGGGGGRGGFRFLDFDMAPAIAEHFNGGAPDSPYFLIWTGDGSIFRNSSGAPDVASPLAPPEFDGPPPAQPADFRQRDNFREAYIYGPFGTRVLVGQSIVNDQKQLVHLAWLLVTTGAVVLVVGLMGGWLVSMRMVRPIERITQTAKDISATNLSRRIDVAGTQSELGQLATVLNDMFTRLDSSFQQQVRFTADASHELRTPLAVIHTHSQLALARERTGDEYRQALNACLRASTRMKGLVDSLLLLAGVDAGRLNLERTEIDLQDVIEECIAMVGPLATEKNVSVQPDLQPVQIDGDALRISQVVINLLSNAIRYNRDAGIVRVALRASNNGAELTIADNGIGIPAEHQPHLFDRFYRVDVARSRDMGGSGLGLAICKSIIDAHGGTIRFTSQPQIGTTFTVWLPAHNNGGVQDAK